MDTWPVHCVAGTEGAEYDPELETSAVTHHVKKGQGTPAYSLFEGVTDDGRTVEQAADREYAGIYRRFAELIRTGRSDVDLSPMIHVADAFTLGRRIVVEPFEF